MEFAGVEDLFGAAAGAAAGLRDVGGGHRTITIVNVGASAGRELRG